MTTILVLAGKYGVGKVVAALTGDSDLGSIVAELFGELRASEDRIADRLSAIEGKLGVLLEQPYSIALGAGQRTLLDAGVSADAEGRIRELRQARVYFREASAAARSKLQVATAERFLGLCCLALREPDAATVAMRASRTAALEGAIELAATPARAVTREMVTAADFCVQLVREANALRSLPSGSVRPLGMEDEPRLFWGVGSGPECTFGPVTVRWLRFEPFGKNIAMGPMVVHVEYEVCLDEALPFPLESCLVAPLYVRPETQATIAPGDLRSRTSCVVIPGVGYGPTGDMAERAIPASFYHVTVGGAFGFYPPDSSPATDSTA
jgi:hypothetical protein